MGQTLYRRPLPSDAIAFSSPEGRQIFVEALETEGLNGYFRLAEQFHTQSDPAFCGLGSLVVALNALAIDPERLWKGPWRWFDCQSIRSEEHTSELQSQSNLVCRLLLEKKNKYEIHTSLSRPHYGK